MAHPLATAQAGFNTLTEAIAEEMGQSANRASYFDSLSLELLLLDSLLVDREAIEQASATGAHQIVLAAATAGVS